MASSIIPNEELPLYNRVGRKLGHPNKFREENREAILDGVRMGMPYKLAAKNGDISYVCLRQWITRGEDEENRRESGEPLYDNDGKPIPKDVTLTYRDERNPYDVEAEYYQFLLDYREADKEATMSLIGTMYDAAQEDPFWAERMLKHRHPELFSDKKSVEVNSHHESTHKVEVEHTHVLEGDTLERISAIIGIINNAKSGGIVEGRLAANIPANHAEDDEVYPDDTDS